MFVCSFKPSNLQITFSKFGQKISHCAINCQREREIDFPAFQHFHFTIQSCCCPQFSIVFLQMIDFTVNATQELETALKFAFPVATDDLAGRITSSTDQLHQKGMFQ